MNGLFIRTIGIARAMTRIKWPISSTTSTPYLPAQPRHRMTHLCYVRRPDPFNSLPNCDQAKSSRFPLTSIPLKISPLIEPSRTYDQVPAQGLAAELQSQRFH